MKAIDIINSYGLEIPKAELEEIMLSLLRLKNKSQLYMSDIEGLSIDKLESFIARRKEGTPLQYLTLNTNFYGFDFKIEESVFIPRPETEVLVDYIASGYPKNRDLRILEIGTGSGVIAICLTKLFCNCKIIATDISSDALRVASENALLNGVRSNILFIRTDLAGCIKKEGVFDLLVSNPPYIGLSQKTLLASDVKREPQQALFGGREGYELTLSLIEKCSALIKRGGEMVIEIDPNHRVVYESRLKVKKLEFVKDLEQRDRVMVAGF